MVAHKAHTRRSLEERFEAWLSEVDERKPYDLVEEEGTPTKVRLEGLSALERVALVRDRWHLTPREIVAVLAMLKTGGQKGAAIEMGVSYQTVKNHSSSLCGKMGAVSFTQAVYRLYPYIGDLFVLPGDDERKNRRQFKLDKTVRSGQDRRRAVQRPDEQS